MIRSEIAEIKKIYSISNCSVSRIAGCYVDGERNIKATFNKSFLSLPEEEIFKYLAIFKKGLTGKIGKNIVTTSFPAESEGNATMHHLLLRMRDTHIKDEEILSSFYKSVISIYPAVENYLILVISNTYDIPGRGDDQFKNMDASDEVYDYISVYLCPVKLESGGLFYNTSTNEFEHKDRRWCVTDPVYSCLFPSFEDRSADIHSITIYTKKTDGEFDDFTKELFSVEPVLSADAQKFIFQQAMQEALQEEKNSMEIINNMNEILQKKLEDESSLPANVSLDKEEIIRVAAESGFSKNACEILKSEMENAVGNEKLFAVNLIDKKSTHVKAPDVVLKVSNDIAHKVKTKVVDDERYLLVPIMSMTEVEINGIVLPPQE